MIVSDLAVCKQGAVRIFTLEDKEAWSVAEIIYDVVGFYEMDYTTIAVYQQEAMKRAAVDALETGEGYCGAWEAVRSVLEAMQTGA
jgi:hypothetical protein